MHDRMWTNSRFGRAIGTIFGVLVVLIPFTVEPEDGTLPWRGWNILIDTAIVGVGVATIVAVWTSRLVLSHGTLTATHFFISRSIPLVDVVDVDPSFLAFLGIKIKGHGKSGIRTLVSGQQWNEWRTPRATKIGEEIMLAASQIRNARLGDEDE